MTGPGYFLKVADARKIPITGELVNLWVTSPPYGLDVTYDGGEDILPEEWPEFMEAACAEMYRLGKPQARLALNVPLDTIKGGHRSVLTDAVQAAEWAKWRFRHTILWAEGNISKSVARGSIDSASSPCIICRSEAILIFHKGDWTLPDKRKTMTREEWLSWTGGTWEVRGETRGWERHPAPFPVEIPRRLIRLLCPLEGVVGDPFCGSSSTGVAALQEGRHYFGCDTSEEYVQSSRRRLEGVV